MKKSIILFVLLLGNAFLFAQNASFTLSVNKDTLLMGHTVKVEYRLKQVQAKGGFDAPEFAHFRVVAGPNISSSVSIVNGDMTSFSTYSFYLKPDSPGTWTIPSVTIETKEGPLAAEKTRIVVLPNPDGVAEEPEPLGKTEFLFRNEAPPQIPQTPKQKTKRKVYRL